MNDVEREAIILNSAWKMIDGMVNWAKFVPVNLHHPTNLMFHDDGHARMFVILLGDFLSQVHAHGSQPIPLGLRAAPAGASLADRTFLYHLRQVCAEPQFSTDATELGQRVDAFAEWLEKEFVAPGVWLSNINVQVDLPVTRYRYLRMCGDIAKHHLGRLSVNAHHLRTLLKGAGHDIGEQEAYLAIEDFFQWFFESIFLYHSSQIAEFLNNIRWEIFHYLEPEFRRSHHLTPDATADFRAYSYHVPKAITEPIAHAMYWDVMNRVRQKPWMPSFVLHELHKRRY